MDFERIRIETRIALDIVRARLRSAFISESPHTRVILNSLPKSGTHLAAKLLTGMPGVSRVRLPLYDSTADIFSPISEADEVEVGVDSPRMASFSNLRRRLDHVPTGAFVQAHVPYSPRFASLLTDLEYRMVLLVRDPRDVALSSASYLANSGHTLESIFGPLDPEQRILASIEGVCVGDLRLRNLRDRVDSVASWRNAPWVVSIRFEDLVGPAGGGNLVDQHETIAAVARHIGTDLDERQVSDLASNLYGGTATFRKGTIGRWRSEFGQDHRLAAGSLVGNQLIELGYEKDDGWWRGVGHESEAP